MGRMMYYDYEAGQFFPYPDEPEPTPVTNYDKFMAMTVGELAEALCLIAGGQGPVSSADGHDWLDWLRQEAQDG